MRLFQLMSLCAMTLASLAASSASAAIIIDNYNAGVVEDSHPNDPAGDTPDAGTYYDVSESAFAEADPSTLNGSPALRHGDGGFTNGIYAVYAGVVPATGLYNVSADILVNDTATSQMTAYQIGVIVNGAHRGPGIGKIANATIFGDYTGLTANALDATTTQYVSTPLFSANAGDSLLIAFSTDVTSGYDGGSGFWNGASVDIDNLMLNLVPEPATLSLAGLGLLGLLAARRRA
jgi:hypothetical protein